MSVTAVAAGTRAAAGPEGAPEEVRRGRRSTPYLLLLPGMAWLVLFFAVPVFALASLSLQTRVPGAEIGVYTQTFRWANYSDALAEYAPQFLRSFLYAGLATLLCLLIGYPLAYAIALKAGRWRNLMLIAVIAPFFTSFILRTIAWRQVLADSGPVTSTLHTLHILPPGQSLTASGTAVVAGLTYNFLPFMVLPLYASLERLDPRLVEAAGDLYATAPVGFRRVTFPLSMPGVVAGFSTAFAWTFSAFATPQLIGGGRVSTVSTLVYQLGFSSFNFPFAASLSIVGLALSLAVIALMKQAARPLERLGAAA